MTETEEPQTKETLLLRGYDLAADAAAINQAGRILRGGGIVAIPTETVYGLAGNALDPDATGKIYAAKGRPSDNPLIVHIDRLEEWPPLVRELPEEALLLATCAWSISSHIGLFLSSFSSPLLFLLVLRHPPPPPP